MEFVGDCYDNAMCESFFVTLECELTLKDCIIHTAGILPSPTMR